MTRIRSKIVKLTLGSLTYLLLQASFLCGYTNNEEEKPHLNTEDTNAIDLGNMWEEKEYLFSLPAIKRMPSSIKRMILRCIQNEKNNVIYHLICNNLSKEELKKLNDEVAKSKYNDLKTVCIAVIEAKPARDDSLLNYWIMESKQKDAFINKTLQLQLSNFPFTHKPIQDFEFINNSKDAIRIILVDNFNTSVTVSRKQNQYHIDIFQTKDEGLFQQFLLKNNNKQISIDKKNPNFCCSLVSGDYNVISLREDGGSSFFKKTINSFKGLHSQYDREINVELESCEWNKDIFRIAIFIYQKKVNGILIRKNNNKIEYWNEKDIDSMLLLYKVKTLKKKSFVLSTEEFKSSVKIDNEVNNDLIRQHNREKINILEKELLDSLFKKEDYNNQLVNILIEKGKITWQDLQGYQSQIPLFEKKIQNIATLYKENLSEKVTAASILLSLVKQTLMNTISRRPSFSETQLLVELLHGAYQHIEKIEGESIFMLVGHTGAGKSTVANYFMGEELIEFVNEIGQKVVENKKVIEKEKKSDQQKESNKQKVDEEIPVIGQKIGNSQTLYARGFQVKKKDRKEFPTLIVDCPGFGDTRTEDHMLCANISIDEAVLKSKSIKGIVLVIPLGAFLIDKGNSPFRLMQIMQDKFPDVFNTQSPYLQYVHMLITKHEQYDKEIVKAFRKGKIFIQILQDLNEQKDLLQEQAKDFHQRQRNISFIEKKKEIWSLMQKIHQGKRIHLVHLHKNYFRKKLLNQYGNVNGEISKSSYRTSLQSYEMSNVSILLKKSFFTWQDIFSDYQKFPKRIKDLTQQEKSIKTSIDIIKNDLEKLSLEAKKLNNLTKRFNSRYQLNNNQQDELNREINKALSSSKLYLKNDLELIEKRAKKTENLIKIKNKEINAVKIKIDEEQKKYEVLSRGVTRKKLWEFGYSSGDYLDIHIENNLQGKRPQSHMGYRSQLKESDIVKKGKKLVDHYVGDIYDDVIIERGYNITGKTNKETEMLNISNMHCVRSAIFDCEKCEIDYRARYKGDNSVMFGIKKHFDGAVPYPSASLTFMIYNVQLNAAEIEKTQSNQSKLKKEKTFLEGHLAALQSTLKETKILLQQRKNEYDNQGLEATITHVSNNIARKKDEKIKKEKELLELQSTLKQIKEEKRRYAFLILEKRDEPDFLNHLAKRLFINSNWKVGNPVDKDSIESSKTIFQNFLNFYDQNAKELYKECEQDFSFGGANEKHDKSSGTTQIDSGNNNLSHNPLKSSLAEPNDHTQEVLQQSQTEIKESPENSPSKLEQKPSVDEKYDGQDTHQVDSDSNNLSYNPLKSTLTEPKDDTQEVLQQGQTETKKLPQNSNSKLKKKYKEVSIEYENENQVYKIKMNTLLSPNEPVKDMAYKIKMAILKEQQERGLKGIDISLAELRNKFNDESQHLAFYYKDQKGNKHLLFKKGEGKNDEKKLKDLVDLDQIELIVKLDLPAVIDQYDTYCSYPYDLSMEYENESQVYKVKINTLLSPTKPIKDMVYQVKVAILKEQRERGLKGVNINLAELNAEFNNRFKHLAFYYQDKEGHKHLLFKKGEENNYTKKLKDLVDLDEVKLIVKLDLAAVIETYKDFFERGKKSIHIKQTYKGPTTTTRSPQNPKKKTAIIIMLLVGGLLVVSLGAYYLSNALKNKKSPT